MKKPIALLLSLSVLLTSCDLLKPEFIESIIGQISSENSIMMPSTFVPEKSEEKSETPENSEKTESSEKTEISGNPEISVTPEGPEEPVDDIEGILNGYEKEHTGSISGVYKSTYKLDVESAYESIKAFGEDIELVVEFDIDYNPSDYYFYAKSTNTKENITTEYLISQEDGQYYYQETKKMKTLIMTNVLNEINSALIAATKSKGNRLTNDSFVCTKDMEYEYNQFLLEAIDIKKEDIINNRTYEKNIFGGVDIVSPLDEVAYTFDTGPQLFNNIDEFISGHAFITTDSKGHVLNFVEKYNSPKMELPITTPSPILTLSGSHSLDAEYDVPLNRKTSISAEVVSDCTITFDDLNQDGRGTIEVYTTAPYNFSLNGVDKLSSGASLVEGNWIWVKPILSDGCTVESITYNGEGPVIDPIQSAGYYIFIAKKGAGQIEYKYSGEVDIQNQNYARVSVNMDNGVDSYTLGSLLVSDPSNITPVTDLVEVDKFLVVKVQCKDGYTVSNVTCNGKNTTFITGYYCYKVTSNEKINVTIQTQSSY